MILIDRFNAKGETVETFVWDEEPLWQSGWVCEKGFTSLKWLGTPLIFNEACPRDRLYFVGTSATSTPRWVRWTNA